MAYPRATIAAMEQPPDSAVEAFRGALAEERLLQYAPRRRASLRGHLGRLRAESADARRDPADARAAGRRASVRLLLAWPPPRFRGGSTGGGSPGRWRRARS